MASVYLSILAQDGDACYLVLKILSDKISTVADVFSLALIAFEIVSNYDLPVNSDLWINIKELKLSLKNNISIS
ncbi:unnamed protein product [Rotaria sp. Silwood1]|nr:unnamed protein product [Rotaria sp. Silwood1]